MIGSLHLPAFLALGGIDPVLAASYLGPWGGLAATWPSLALAALAGVAHCAPSWRVVQAAPRFVLGAIVIGLLSIAVFAAGHHPWSVTFGFTVWGAKIATLLGADFSQAEFWQWAGPKRALDDSILSDTSSLTNLGMIFGAMAAAAASAPFARNPWPPLKSLVAAALWRSADGLGRAARLRLQHRRLRRRPRSGSLHGWVWFAAALPGCYHRHQAPAAVRPVARVDAMRLVYAIVFVIGFAADLADHLTSPSTAGRCRRRISPAPARPVARLPFGAEEVVRSIREIR